MNFADFIQRLNPTLVPLRNRVFYRVGLYSFTHFVWDESSLLFSRPSDPPPLESLRGRSVVACSIPYRVPGRPNAWIFLDPDQPYWNFKLDQNLIQHLRTLEKCEGHERDRLYPQYERLSEK